MATWFDHHEGLSRLGDRSHGSFRARRCHLSRCGRTMKKTPVILFALVGSAIQACPPRRRALLDYENQQRSNAEQDQWIACRPVGNAPPARRVQILLNCQRPDVAAAVTVELAGRTVMRGVEPAPVMIRSEGQYARDEADGVVRTTRGKKRSMATVVEDDENAYEESAGDDRQGYREPDRRVGNQVHEIPQAGTRKARIACVPRLMFSRHAPRHSPMIAADCAVTYRRDVHRRARYAESPRVKCPTMAAQRE